MRPPSIARSFAATAAVALVASACGPRFDPAEITNAPGTTVQVPLADGGTVDDGSGFVTDTPTESVSGDPFAFGSEVATEASAGGDTGASGGDTSSGGTDSGGSTGGGSSTGSGSGSTGSSGGTSGGSSGGGAAATTDPGPKPGVTDTKCSGENVNAKLGCIKIGVLVPKTGAAPVPSDFDSGVSLYWWEKAAAGGTHGRQVQLIVLDTESKINTATSQAQKLLQQGVFTIVSLDRLEVQQAIGDFMEKAKVPHVMVQAPTPYPKNWVNTFTISIDHTAQGRAVAEHWANDLGAKNGAIPVGVVREQTAALKPGTDAMIARAKDFKLNVVANETIDPTRTDFNSTVLKICGGTAPPKIVWLYMAPTPALTIMQQAATQNCNPTWFANSISWNLDLAQANPLAPSKSGAFSPWVSVQHPRAAKYRAAYQKYNNAPADDLGLASWGLSEVIDSALEATGPNLGRDTFRTALQNLKVSKYDTWGPIDCGGSPPYICSKHVAVYTDNNTTWKMVGDFRTFG